MAEEYVDLGYVDLDYVESGIAPPPAVIEGEYDLDVGSPGAARHRSPLYSTRALELAYWQPGSPWAPYDVQPVFTLVTPIGRYGWSDRAVPQGVEDQCLRFEVATIAIDPLSFRSTPVHGNLIGSIGTFERSQGRVVIPDPTGVWAKKITTEAIECMPAGLFWLVKGLWTQIALSGTVGEFSYEQRTLTILFGNFRRQSPTSMQATRVI